MLIVTGFNHNCQLMWKQSSVYVFATMGNDPSGTSVTNIPL